MFNSGGRIVSPPDPYLFNEYSSGTAGYSLSQGRTQVSSIVSDRANTKIIIMDGQSEMSTSNGTSTYTVVNSQSHNLNIYDGGIYAGSEPVLGSSYFPTIGVSSMAMRIADRIITRSIATRVIIIPIAVGNTYWALYETNATNSLFTRISAAYKRIVGYGLLPDVIITARGATDNTMGTSSASIKNSIWSWADGIRNLGCVCPIYVGKFTMTSGSISSAVRTGIDNSIDAGRDIRVGYDGDNNLTVAGGFRLADQTHLSNTGLTTGANGWADLLYP